MLKKVQFNGMEEWGKENWDVNAWEKEVDVVRRMEDIAKDDWRKEENCRMDVGGYSGKQKALGRTGYIRGSSGRIIRETMIENWTGGFFSNLLSLF